MLTQQGHSQPTILAFMSGKGGVGKTMLAVAAARELSLSNVTLILDLDFFNRGLSGLLSQGSKQEPIDPPEFLGEQRRDEWFFMEVENNLYTVSFPDVKEPTTLKLDDSTVRALKEQLHKWIGGLCRKFDCQTVVLDCHGGPDALSFAAAMVADQILLISEPDRITLYGTFHFLRRLSEVSIGTSNVHFIFNKVVDSFTPRFLVETYNDQLRQFFSNKRNYSGKLSTARPARAI